MPRFYPTVELAPGADLTAQPSSWSWTDLTQLRYVHEPSGISISHGRQNRNALTSPATCGLTLLNPNGIWVPDNPVGTYYGLIGQNTPLRVLNRPVTNSLSDAFSRSVSSGWGSADSGGAWTTTGGSASDYSVAAASGGRHTHPSVSVSHYSLLSLSIVRADLRVRVRVNALSTGGSQACALMCRFVDIGNHRRAELQFATDGSITARLVQRDSGTDTVNASEPTGLTHSTTSWYWIRLQTGLTSARMKVWLDGSTEPPTWLIDGESGFFSSAVAGTLGVWSRRESGNTNASAAVDFDDFAMVDGPLIRFTGYVDAWPTTWADASERQSFAPITASGRLRLIGQAQQLKSAFYRASTTTQWSVIQLPTGYWPMEDRSGARVFASGLSGGLPMQFTDMRPAADSGIAGSDPLPSGGGAATFYGVIPARPASDEWAVRALMKFPSLPSVNSGVLAWATEGTVNKWAFVINSAGTWSVHAYVGATEVLGTPSTAFTDADGGSLVGRQFYMAADAYQAGTDINWALTLYSDTGGTPVQLTGSYAGTVGNVTRIFHSAFPGYTDGGYTIGHVGASDALAWALDGDLIATGHAGETTAARLQRLCAEENVASYFGEILGDGVGSTAQLMGPQQTASLIAQLREVEATEEGILFDGLQGQVTLLPRRQRQNHAVNLTLDHVAGHLAAGFVAEWDDQLVRNDIKVTNATGATGVASDRDAIRSRGVNSESVTINAQHDTGVIQHATWRRNLGRTTGRRYPAIKVEFHNPRNSGLIAGWLECDIGSRLVLQNLPNTYDDAGLLIEGYTEDMDSSTWTVRINASPAQPWDVFTLEDDDLGQLDTSGSTLLTGYDSSATSLLVATANNKATWSATAEPYHWEIGGEKIRVDTMNAPGATFVNAGTATHADNAALSPSLPASAQKGDLLLVFCAIRNAAATIATPTGYTALLSDGNVALFGKLHTGSESAPSVAFSGGSAGDTTSAQMAAFRLTQLDVVYDDSSSNSSAQDIAVPAFLPPQHNLVVLWLGWKQDDWTSVATLYGTEIGEPSSATGSDQGLVWDYEIQTTATGRAAASLAVTGGTSAISKGYVVALAGDVQSCTVTRSINGVAKSHSAAAAVSLWKPGVWAL